MSNNETFFQRLRPLEQVAYLLDMNTADVWSDNEGNGGCKLTKNIAFGTIQAIAFCLKTIDIDIGVRGDGGSVIAWTGATY